MLPFRNGNKFGCLTLQIALIGGSEAFKKQSFRSLVMATQRKDNVYCNQQCPLNCSRYGPVTALLLYFRIFILNNVF